MVQLSTRLTIGPNLLLLLLLLGRLRQRRTVDVKARVIALRGRTEQISQTKWASKICVETMNSIFFDTKQKCCQHSIHILLSSVKEKCVKIENIRP